MRTHHATDMSSLAFHRSHAHISAFGVVVTVNEFATEMETTGADQVSAAAGVPVQPQEQQPLMREQKKKKIRMMVAIDESENSFYALRWAIDHLADVVSAELETNQEGGLLTLVHVQPPFQHFVYPAGGTAVYASASVPESVRKAQQENTAALLARALQMCRGKMIKAETLILEGDAKDAICEAVEQTNADLLVVGSRGLGMIKRALLGSVSDYCAHHAKCPILVVKPPKETAN